MSEAEALKAFQSAQVDPSEENLAALRPHLADEIDFTGLSGQSTAGPVATLDALKDPQVSRFLAPAQWSEASRDGELSSLTATLAPGAPIGGATIRFTFADGRITKVSYERLPAVPVPVTQLALTDEIKEGVDSALASGNPMLIAYVRSDGYPSLSFRGSTHVWSDTDLAVWVRNPDGGLLAALKENDHVSFWLRRAEPVMVMQFWGRARVQNDDETRDKVFSGAPEAEQRADPERRGMPIIVELDRVEGRVGRNPVRMARNEA
jgi:hypothetical protein